MMTAEAAAVQYDRTVFQAAGITMQGEKKDERGQRTVTVPTRQQPPPRTSPLDIKRQSGPEV